MHEMRRTLWATFLPVFILFTGASIALGQDVPKDYAGDENEVTARVARISYIKGNAQIRRVDNDDWERVTKNLPIVEGDEIATGRNTRIEIQFDTYKFLRLEEKAFLKITTLRDEGIAVSLPEGSLNLRLFEFEKDDEFFEIDAPKTTIAVQKAGMYRVNAGDNNYTVVEINVTEGGKAQVYSENAGFTLRNGRRARVFTEGQYAGEWDLGDAERNMDQFDNWSLERDEIIAKRLDEAYYDRYYDRGIYGAEDLNDFGEWIYTRNYGYVWKPYPNAISQYDNWSPYRYGQWRWVPAFGWTWVNYEPWGWATYHYGRWVFYDGYWVWTPYPRYRPRRSWWRPALVIFASIGRDIYWCPLPYDYGYYGYDRRRGRRGYGNDNGDRGNPTPTPTPTPTATGGGELIRPNDGTGRVFGNMPVGSVTSVPRSEFGRGNGMFREANPEVAQKILISTPQILESPPILPTYKDLNGEMNEKIRVKNPTYAENTPTVKTGATDRKTGVSMDEKLRRERIHGNRSPIVNNKTDDKSNGDSNRRSTGAVKRSPKIVSTPTFNNKSDRDASTNTKSRSVERKSTPPVYTPPRRTETKREEPKYEPPPRREEPKYEPPPQREEPKYEPPPPTREEPKYEPPPSKNESPPPAKSEPKPPRSKIDPLF